MSLQRIELPFDVEVLPVKKLSAGTLSCFYEKGNLRYIRRGNEEVVRMIYSAVRDENWATATYDIEDESIEEGKNRFFICYTAIHQLNDIRYKAIIQITGEENTISFTMQGEALSDFLSNRIGICVHHPVQECAGKKVVIIHPDGGKMEAFFPKQINPHQPFKQVQQMTWEPGSAITVQLSFEGDVFETEDQRNWTDYSFKTYSTPLDIPFPVQVKKGDQIQQQVTLNMIAPVASPEKDKNEQVSDTVRLPFTKIGYERAPGSPQLTADEMLLLQEVLFNHYRVVLHLSNETWIDELDMAAAEAKVLGVPIEVVAFFSSSPDEEISALSVNLQRFPEQVLSVLLLQENCPTTPGELLQKAYPVLKANLPHLKVGYGTDGFFAELNRDRPPQDTLFDFVSFSMNPQVHATDTRTLLENLRAQSDAVSLARSFAPEEEVFVSPVTWKIRTGGVNDSAQPSDEDSRQYTAFGAMWTLLALKHLAGADRVTLYQATGYRGVLHQSGNHPLYQALAQLKSFCPKWVLVNNAAPEILRIQNEKGEEMEFAFSNFPATTVFV